jgi:hypothetical protein
MRISTIYIRFPFNGTPSLLPVRTQTYPMPALQSRCAVHTVVIVGTHGFTGVAHNADIGIECWRLCERDTFVSLECDFA